MILLCGGRCRGRVPLHFPLYGIKEINDVKLHNWNRFWLAFGKGRACLLYTSFGVGDAHLVCQAAQMKFARIGINCTAYSDTALMLATASLLGEDDVVVGISFSGDTRVVVDATRIARENGAKTICIVHFEKSKLAKYADIRLFTATKMCIRDRRGAYAPH